MIRYQKVSGVNLENSNGLPTIKRTPEGIAMGAVPGWSMMYDPDYTGPDLYIRNRAVPNRLSPGLNAVGITSFDNGTPAFLASDASTLRIEPQTGDVDPDRWSVFFVVQDYATTSGYRQNIIVPVAGSTLGEVCLNIALNPYDNGRLVVYSTTSYSSVETEAGRIGYDANLVSTSISPQLFIVTFSIENGLTIRRNGVQVAVEANDRRPLTAGFSKQEMRLFYGLRGKYGMTGVINTDLSATENAGHLRAIESFLLGKYGIPKGENVTS